MSSSPLEKELSTGAANDAKPGRGNYFSYRDRRIRQLHDFNEGIAYKSEAKSVKQQRLSKAVLVSSYMATGALVAAGVVTSNVAYLVGAASTIITSSAYYSVLRSRE